MDKHPHQFELELMPKLYSKNIITRLKKGVFV